jgi:hypothetical protein
LAGITQLVLPNRYELEGSGIESRWRARFFAPVQTDPGAHAASYSMGTGSFPGVKRPRCGVDHPHPSSAEVKERVEIYLYSLSGSSWPVLRWTLPLPLRYKLYMGGYGGQLQKSPRKSRLFFFSDADLTQFPTLLLQILNSPHYEQVRSCSIRKELVESQLC